MDYLSYRGAVYREADIDDIGDSNVVFERRLERNLTSLAGKFISVARDNRAAFSKVIKEGKRKYPDSVAQQLNYLTATTSQWASVQDVVKAVKNIFVTKGKPLKQSVLDRVEQDSLSAFFLFVLGALNEKTLRRELKGYLREPYKKKQQDRGRSQQRRICRISPEFERFMPEFYAFQVFLTSEVVDGKVVKGKPQLKEELSIWGNKLKDVQEKTDALSAIVKNWNSLVAQVRKDLHSNDPFTQMCATILLIIIQTGIRPGERGESRKRGPEGDVMFDTNGKPMMVTTFGASGLLEDHITFIRDDLARVYFQGKADVTNVATLTDKELIQVLRPLVEKVRSDLDLGVRTRGDITDDKIYEGQIFVLSDGRRVTEDNVNKYIHSIMGSNDVTAMDFRKLKASVVFYDSLVKNKARLAAELRGLKVKIKSHLRAQIIPLITAHIEASLEEARKALSHDSFKETVQSYIEPKILLAYLTDAGMEFSLERCVGNGYGMVVHFDYLDFYKKAIAAGESCPVETVIASFKRQAGFGNTKFEFGERFIDFSLNDALRWLELDVGPQKPIFEVAPQISDDLDQFDTPELKAASYVQYIRYLGAVYQTPPKVRA